MVCAQKIGKQFANMHTHKYMKRLGIYMPLSMTLFRQQVTAEKTDPHFRTQVMQFGEKYLKEIEQFFCHVMKYQAQWPGAPDEPFHSPPLFQLEDFTMVSFVSFRFIGGGGGGNLLD
jgi:hypothetical protein